ncbi:hypothetical protein [Enterobacter chengduensis]|uniref:hypothetical protein n=1 Tax=Enterobacter chengduensis TaxID=2494701 RepID=UPI002005D4BE|nr:hypothetical protein [Enterobacter chengduensis]MCK7427937.1 hypothetical protein [Enterobacter chengduensis]
MRDFELHGRGHGRGFGRHRMGKGLAIGAVIFIVLGLLVMSLWNALLPAILGVKAIGFWQALGILVLSRILFGGLGFRPGMFGAHRRMQSERDESRGGGRIHADVGAQRLPRPAESLHSRADVRSR